MKTEEVIKYLRAFADKAISGGGFTANDGRNILNAIDHIEAELTKEE